MAGNPNSYGTRAQDIKSKQPMSGNGNSTNFKAAQSGVHSPDANGHTRNYRAQPGNIGTGKGTGAGGGHGMVGHHASQSKLASGLIAKHFGR
jgi:hypothetical protein